MAAPFRASRSRSSVCAAISGVSPKNDHHVAGAAPERSPGRQHSVGGAAPLGLDKDLSIRRHALHLGGDILVSGSDHDRAAARA